MYEVPADAWPAWLRPPPSLLILCRPRPERLLVIRYAPGLAARFCVTPAKLYGQFVE